MSDNHLNYIDLTPLSKCKDLRWLYIADNDLTEIDLSPFANHKNLQYIVLSGNRLEEIDISFIGLSNDLRYLHLNENCIYEIDISTLFNCENLESFVIDPQVSLRANHKLKHQSYFPLPVKEILDNIQWIHE